MEDLTPRLSKITITLRLNESVIQIRTQSVWITGFLCWLRSRNSVSYFTKQRHLTFQVMCHVCALFRGLWPQMRLASERQSCGHTVLRMVRASNSDCMLIVINRLVFVMEMRCVFCEVGIDYLRVIHTNFRLQRLKHNGISPSHPHRGDANETATSRKIAQHDGGRR